MRNPDANYWEQPKPANPTFLAAPPTTSSPSFLEKIGSVLGSFFRNGGTETPFSMDPGYPSNQYAAPPNDPPAVIGPSSNSSISSIGQDPLGILAYAAANPVEALSSDPESLWARLAGQNPYAAYSGPSAQDIAKAEFAPQYQILDQIAKQQAANYDRGNKDLGSMYNSLAKDTYAGADKIKGSFANAADQVNASGDAAAQRVNNNVQQSNNALLGEMARLGLNEGAPALMDKSQATLTNQLANLSGQTQSSANLMDTLGANAYAYGRERGDINKQAGVEHQADLLNRYNQAQTDNANTRLNLQGQEQAAINKYLMDISKMNQEGQNMWYDNIQNRVNSILGYDQNQASNDMRMAQLDLDKAKYQNSQSGSTPNAYDILQQRASDLTGGDPNLTAKLTQRILEAWRSNPQGTAGQLMSQLDPEILAANPQLAMLAFDFFNRVGARP